MQNLLKSYFGFEQFRPGQQQVISSIEAGRSAAAIFPTGSGKSLCYQLPALYLPHLTIVVSPLLALIQDQLSFLQSKGISAASIDSTLTQQETQAVMFGVRNGEIKILMVSVERFNNERFREFIKQINISLLVVDEAHCISEWGHNFRPDYLKLPQYKQELRIPQVLLLTATATPKVIADMAAKFDILHGDIVTTGFYRANLNLQVTGVKAEDKNRVLLNWLHSHQGIDGIVYVTLQQTAEQVAAVLQRANINAMAYHAGMDNDKRQQIQQAFMSGHCPIIVATIAFGMGIDKQNIGFVVHYDLPKSIENYAQEIGRAGRDGQVADCLVLANTDNVNVLENFVYGDTPDKQGIAVVLEQIKQAGQTSNQWEVLLNPLSTESNVRLLSLKTLLVYLEMHQLITPAYSYFAEYKFKLLCDEAELINRFNGERQQFVAALIHCADKAKIWYSIDFDKLNQHYPCDRSRAVAAINYFEEKGFIELQTKQMTQVYWLNQRVEHGFNQDIENIDSLAEELALKFQQKELSEVARIQSMINLMVSDQCLSRQLAAYFGEQLAQDCGHCSVCVQGPAQLEYATHLTPLEQMDFHQLCGALIQQLAQRCDANQLARALCGLTTPIFTPLKLRRVNGFAQLEKYPFAQVRSWCEANL